MFRARRGGPKPDLTRASVVDHGQTVRLGDYEAATDAILYELDPAARRRAKQRALVRDQSLGAAIRRLRLQRGLGRADFAGVSSKTLARVERGETKPHRRTLTKIAKRLGVAVEELGTF